MYHFSFGLFQERSKVTNACGLFSSVATWKLGVGLVLGKLFTLGKLRHHQHCLSLLCLLKQMEIGLSIHFMHLRVHLLKMTYDLGITHYIQIFKVFRHLIETKIS